MSLELTLTSLNYGKSSAELIFLLHSFFLSSNIIYFFSPFCILVSLQLCLSSLQGTRGNQSSFGNKSSHIINLYFKFSFHHPPSIKICLYLQDTFLLSLHSIPHTYLSSPTFPIPNCHTIKGLFLFLVQKFLFMTIFSIISSQQPL